MAFRNSEGKGGSLNWKSKSIGGYLRLEFRRHGGVLDLEFPQGKDESVFLENAYFNDLISLQTKHELTTLLKAAQDKHPLISDVFIWYSLVEENQQKVGFTSSSRKTCCKTSFFSLMKTASQIILSIRCQTWSFDTISSFKPRRLKFKMAEIKTHILILVKLLTKVRHLNQSCSKSIQSQNSRPG